MTKIERLAPHDPVPEGGAYALVLRRLAEDTPAATITELVFTGADPQTRIHTGELEAAVRDAETEAERRGLTRLYVLDRTAGRLEHEALQDHGERSFAADTLDDTDPEDGEQGADLRDRPHDAGYMR